MAARELPGGRLSCTTCSATFRGAFQRCPRDGALLVPEDIDPLLGQTLGGRYVIETLIGEGGLGRVYRASHVKISRRYAIKVPFGDLAGDERLRRRFLQEAEAASRLEHPNLVHVIDVGETASGLLYLVMDFVDGDSLARVIGGAPMTPALAASLIGQIAAGLGHAHDRGLVHRDLKPDNVLVIEGEHGPVPRIVDFGIAIFRDDDNSRVTTQGIVMGTPHYMAPEQSTGARLDARADLFALGVILYEMLAGVLPFEGAALDIARQHIAATPPPIAERVPGLDVDVLLEALAFWMMAKKPHERPPDAATVVELIRLIDRDREAAQAQLANRAPTEPSEPPPPAVSVLPAIEPLPTGRAEVTTARIRPRPWPIVGLVALLAVALITIVVLATRPGPQAADDRVDDRVATPDPEPPTAPPSDLPAPTAGPDHPAVEPATPVRARPGSGSSDRRTSDRHPSRVADTMVVRPIDRVADTTRGAPAPPPPEVDAAAFKRLYASVGERLNRAFAAGDPRAAALRARYTELPFLEALRDPAEAARVERELRDLGRQLP